MTVDRVVVRMVVGFIGVYALASLGIAAAIAIQASGHHPIDPLGFGFLTSSGGMALGGIVGLLAKTSSPEPGESVLMAAPAAPVTIAQTLPPTPPTPPTPPIAQGVPDGTSP